MSHEHKRAIERIEALCRKSKQPSFRLLRIYDIALEVQGMTRTQRMMEMNLHLESGVVNRWLEHQEKERERNQKRRLKREADHTSILENATNSQPSADAEPTDSTSASITDAEGGNPLRRLADCLLRGLQPLSRT